MPKIIGYTPPWLSRPAGGAKIFTDPAPQSPASPSKRASYFGSLNDGKTTEYQGPRRLLAQRGAEIFTVVGNKLRWADLSAVKRAWEENKPSWKRDSRLELVQQGQHEEESPQYRTLVVPVYYQIRQLIISPSGMFLAICTEHTVHIAVLPDSSRLKDHDQSPLKLKTYQLGPTTHVIPESPIVSALWHPLGVATNSSDCLVTVTAEAAVRVWELDRSNQWSFERPALAIDLKKLADGVSCDEGFEPSGFGKSRGFSVDIFDMEASAACFGGHGRAEEDPWASMTLWIAMRNGDVYALCPLLPSKWAPTLTTIPSLSTKAVSKVTIASSYDTNPEEQRAANQQYEWVQEIDSDEQVMTTVGSDAKELEVRPRPINPSAIPRLQGPFEFQLENDFTDLEVSDIHVISPKLDEDELLSGEEDYGDFEAEGIDGLPFSLICLATTDGKVYICMDLEGVSGQWLPKKARNTFEVPESDTKELVLVESFPFSTSDGSVAISEWPMFTSDPSSHHKFFLTTRKRLYAVSLADWCSRLGPELFSVDREDHGLPTRLRAACQTQIYDSEELISVTESSSTPDDLMTTPIVFEDSELGSILVTSTPSKAYAVVFDQHHTLLAEDGTSDRELQSLRLSASHEKMISAISLLRPHYEIPNVFVQPATAPLKHFLSGNLPPNRQQALKQPIRLSPATLEIITSAHRILSSQTSRLEKAAAELFRKCERMRVELNEQVKQMAELADRLQHINGGDDSEELNGLLESRITKAQDRQKKLAQKYDSLRLKSAKANNVSRELSTKEVAWANEVQDLTKIFGLEGSESATGLEKRDISGRFMVVKQLAEELLEQSKGLEKARFSEEKSNTNEDEGNMLHRPSNSISSRLQREKIKDVMVMVEREGAIIDAVMARLDRLSA